MNETTIQIVITALITAAAPTILAIAALVTSRAAAKAAAKAVDVAVITSSVASQKADDLAAKTETIHILVNSERGALMKVSAQQARRIADLTKAPEDVALAEVAEALWTEHMAKQAVVDSGVSKTTGKTDETT